MLDPLYYLIGAIIIIGPICLLLRGKRSPETIQGVATLCGIFGTFGGIAYALSTLDFDNLSETIPQLLNGIYPAFFSSLVGVAISLFVYFSPNFWKQKYEEIGEDSDIDSQILYELKLLNKGITGDNETSLNTRLLKFKDTINEKLDELKKSFNEFAEKMAENNMKALEEVIKDFNTELQEQFGENFKQLNDAVGKLLEWQENYKQMITSTNEELKNLLKSLEAFEGSAESLKKITEAVETFKITSDLLKEHMEELRNNIGSLSDFSKQLDGKGDAISKELKEITEKSLTELGENMASLANALVRDYEKIFDLLQKINQEKNNLS